MTTADGTRLRLLLNATALLVAAADDTDPDAVTAPFRTVPGSDLFTVAGLHVAEPAELERPLTDRDTTALTHGERKDIAYHRRPESATPCSTGSTDQQATTGQHRSRSL